jgi:hypothetical protein
MTLRRKPTSFWKWLALVTASVSLVVVFACNSPYIPIPPPDPGYSQDSSSGDWAVSMPANIRAIGAVYYFYNAKLGAGIIQKASPDGSAYAFPLHGQAGDPVYIHWEHGIDSSSTICRPLGEGTVRMVCQ